MGTVIQCSFTFDEMECYDQLSLEERAVFAISRFFYDDFESILFYFRILPTAVLCLSGLRVVL